MAKRLTVAKSKRPGKPTSFYIDVENDQWLADGAARLSAKVAKDGHKAVSKSGLLNKLLSRLRESGTVIDVS